MILHSEYYRISFADTDAGGVVYHARYLEMAERGRNAALRANRVDLCMLFEQQRLAMVVRKVMGTFRAPARFDDNLQIQTALATLSAARSWWKTRILRRTTLICELQVEIVCVDLNRGKPVLLPENMLHALATINKDAKTLL